MEFELHPELQKNCVHVADLPVCRVLLQKNGLWPWIILVPMRRNIFEIFDLDALDYESVMQEVRDVAQRFKKLTKADKMNVATLGNQVPQLHIHIIARTTNDPAWPNPVWNSGNAPLHLRPPEEEQAVNAIREMLR